MKRTFLFLLLVLLTWEVRADYTPFVVEGKTWVIEFDYDWEMNTLRLLERVKPEEWDFLERFKKGELLGEKRPLHAYAYDKFLGFANRFEKWAEGQM